jgi:hypothetical protein
VLASSARRPALDACTQKAWRPLLEQSLRKLILQFARENPHWDTAASPVS